MSRLQPKDPVPVLDFGPNMVRHAHASAAEVVVAVERGRLSLLLGMTGSDPAAARAPGRAFAT